MRTLGVGILLGTLSVYRSFKIFEAEIFQELFVAPASAEAWYLSFALILSCYLIVEGIYQVVGRSRKTETAQAVDSQGAENEPEKSGFSQSLAGDLSQADEKISQLQKQLESSETRANKFEAELAELKRGMTSRTRDEVVNAEIIHLLSLLQEKGRFIDFLMGDITQYQDAQVGVAARVVHQGCRSVVSDYFNISSIHSGEEGEQVTLEGEATSGAYKLIGQVPEHPPYRGRVIHKGWRSEKITLPRLVTTGEVTEAQVSVIAPAQLDIS